MVIITSSKCLFLNTIVQIMHTWKYRVLTDSLEVHVIFVSIIMTVTSISDMALQMNLIFQLRSRMACIINQINRID